MRLTVRNSAGTSTATGTPAIVAGAATIATDRELRLQSPGRIAPSLCYFYRYLDWFTHFLVMEFRRRLDINAPESHPYLYHVRIVHRDTDGPEPGRNKRRRRGRSKSSGGCKGESSFLSVTMNSCSKEMNR